MKKLMAEDKGLETIRGSERFRILMSGKGMGI